MHLTKCGRLRSWKALDFKKWGRGLEPRSLTEVYAYVFQWRFWGLHFGPGAVGWL